MMLSCYTQWTENKMTIEICLQKIHVCVFIAKLNSITDFLATHFQHLWNWEYAASVYPYSLVSRDYNGNS